jgi:NADP-dependent 3-hydroxy acid dehydrogenase YdfG
MTLDGKVAAITGASAGIGLAVAEHLSREGVAVVLGARRLDLIEQHVAKIRAAGGRAEAVKMDVTSEEDVTQLVVRAQEAFGGLDIMMCNAGFGFYGTVEQTPVDVMRRMMDVNFTGTFIGARAALPIFRRQGHGHLLITSSIAGRRGIPFMSGYSATKAAQAVFAEGLRSEFSGTDIHVTVIYPVSTSTEYHHAMERDYGQYISGLGPKQSVDDVARTVLDCLQRPRPEVFPHRTSRALAVLNVLAPKFTDGLVRRYGRRRDAKTATSS